MSDDASEILIETPQYRLGRALGLAFIECRRCGLRSYHLKDVDERYCGRCHLFHAEVAEWIVGAEQLTASAAQLLVTCAERLRGIPPIARTPEGVRLLELLEASPLLDLAEQLHARATVAGPES